MDERRWHIFRVFSGNEVAAAKACGVEAYVPHKTVQYYNRRQRVNVRRREPMLPGYVFMRTNDPRTIVMPANPRFMGFMRNGDRSWAFLTHQAFKMLMLVEEELSVVEELKLPALRPGTTVLFNNPWFGELKAVVKNLRGDRALIELLDNVHRVEVDVSHLAVA